MRRPLNLLLLLIILVGAASVWAGRGGRIPFLSDRLPARGASTIDSGQGLDAPTIHLLILNGTDRERLAGEVSLLVPGAGCLAENLGNAPSGDYPVSLLINRRLDQERAADLAWRLGGLPVLQEWDDRGTEDAVLVLGDDYETVMKALGR